MATARAGAGRRCRRAVRGICALLGRARTPRRVRSGERCPSRGLGVAELRHGGAGSRGGARDPVRGSRHRPGSGCGVARPPPRGPGRAARRRPRSRACVVGRPLPQRAQRRAARRRRGGGRSASPRDSATSALPAPDAPWRDAPAARSSARDRRRRDRASAFARAVATGAPSPSARRGPPVRPVHRAPRAAR